APMPGLLGKLDPEEALAILAEGGEPLPLPAKPLREKEERRPRRVRLIAACLVAAAVVVTAILVPTLSQSSSKAQTTNVALSQAVASPLTASVVLTRASWGTRVDMTCTYAARYGGLDQTYQLFVVDRLGHASLVSSWRSGPGDVARTTGSTDLNPSEIAAVQVRDTSGVVLLKGSV
ncbi:MAG TPA: hypothetical protein VN108_10990, partial [Marmoricola sp.]|nr:hypothetical protein [Marmoricola sp.]